jgi:predicted MPP superfamily phosphohydrolase
VRFRRAALYLFAAAAFLALALGLSVFWLEPASLTISDERIDLPVRLQRPLRVAVLTDLHVGSPFNSLSKLRDVVDRTNAAHPDLICVLGDLVIQGVAGGRFVAPEDIAPELGRLAAPAGTVAVLGNHDGWLGHDRVQAALERQGVRVIEDTAVAVETRAGRIWLAGISDLWTGRHDIVSALAAVKDDGAPILLLTHNPDVFPSVPARVALTIAGHTHGGQVRLPFVGRPIVPSRFGQRYAAGLVVEEGRHLFVATGLGTSILPVRFRVPPSVTVITLTPAASTRSGIT